MAVSGKFELRITTNTQEEMDRIAEAIFNGYAENVLKERILWSQYAPTVSPVRDESANVVLKKMDSEVTSVAPTPIPAPIKTERSKGVIGRSRLGRSQK